MEDFYFYAWCTFTICEQFCNSFELNNLAVKLYNWTLKFCQVVQQQVVNLILAFLAV